MKRRESNNDEQQKRGGARESKRNRQIHTSRSEKIIREIELEVRKCEKAREKKT